MSKMNFRVSSTNATLYCGMTWCGNKSLRFKIMSFARQKRLRAKKAVKPNSTKDSEIRNHVLEEKKPQRL